MIRELGPASGIVHLGDLHADLRACNTSPHGEADRSAPGVAPAPAGDVPDARASDLT